MTLVERRDPAAMSAEDEQEAERRAAVPVPRKRAVSTDTVGEREPPIFLLLICNPTANFEHLGLGIKSLTD